MYILCLCVYTFKKGHRLTPDSLFTTIGNFFVSYLTNNILTALILPQLKDIINVVLWLYLRRHRFSIYDLSVCMLLMSVVLLFCIELDLAECPILFYVYLICSFGRALSQTSVLSFSVFSVWFFGGNSGSGRDWIVFTLAVSRFSTTDIRSRSSVLVLVLVTWLEFFDDDVLLAAVALKLRFWWTASLTRSMSVLRSDICKQISLSTLNHTTQAKQYYWLITAWHTPNVWEGVWYLS